MVKHNELIEVDENFFETKTWKICADSNFNCMGFVSSLNFPLKKEKNYDDWLKSSIAESTKLITDSDKSGYESLIATGMLSQ